MGIEKDKIKTLEETGEHAPMDEVEERVEAKMKRVEGKRRRMWRAVLTTNVFSSEDRR